MRHAWIRHAHTAAAWAALLLTAPVYAEEAVKVVHSADVRGGPGADHKVTGEVHHGEFYVRIAAEGKWRKIWYGHDTAWVHVEDVDPSKEPIRVVTADHLVVRAGPGPGYDKVGVAPKNSWWVVLEQKGDWRKICFRGHERWVHSGHLAIHPPDDHPDLPKSTVGFVQLPGGGPGFVASVGEERRWGKPALVYGLMAAAKSWSDGPDRPKIGIGDISKKLGGHFPPHVSHQVGEDVDIRPVGKGSYTGPLTIYSSLYSSTRTKDWIVHHLNQELKLDVIFFNDPKIHGSLSYVSPLEGHSDHLHVRIK